MAGIGDRIAGWIDSVSERWKDKLRGWALRTMSEGLVKGLEDLEPGAIEGYKTSLTQLRDNPNMPEGIRAFLTKALATGNPISTVGAMLFLPFQAFGIMLGGSQPAANLFMYEQDKVLQTLRLDPQSIMTLWRRNPPFGEAFFDDLREQGWSEARIDALKVITQFYPSAQDLVTWSAREVFEQDAISKYGLDAEFEKLDLSLFAGAAVTEEQARNYWRAHWQHTSFQQMVELLHRGLLVKSGETPPQPTTPAEWAARDAEGTEELYEWYRLVEIPPHWRDLLTASVWNVPTRVDVRRWWDMRVITEDELYSIYHRQGYHGRDAELYVKWTKVYTDFPYWLSRWQKGWVTEEDVRNWLRSLDIPEDRIDIFIQDKIKPEAGARVESELTLTKSEIYKGVKAGRITREEAISLLMAIGNNRAEAEYLLDVNIPPDEEDSAVEQRELTKTDIKAALQQGIIGRDEALSRLLDLRYTQVDAELLLKIYEAQAQPPEQPALKEASKADIVMGVKKGLVNQEEAYLMLQQLGYTPEASQFILTVQTQESPFSPTNFEDFNALVQKGRLAMGLQATPVSDELRAASQKVVELTGVVNDLKRQLAEFNRNTVPVTPVPEDVNRQRLELETNLSNAERSLAAASSRYQDLVAKWKAQEG